MTRTIAVVVTLLGAAVPSMTFAQDGCQTVRSSCSQMLKTCESRCQGSPRCLPACSSALDTCKQTGVWRASSSPACWRFAGSSHAL